MDGHRHAFTFEHDVAMTICSDTRNIRIYTLYRLAIVALEYTYTHLS